VVLNLFGQGLPLLVAIFILPTVIKALGTDGFGFLSLTWVVIGYFSLFDLGVGRALTKLVADRLGSGKLEEIPGLVWTCLLLMLVLGMVGALVLLFIATPLVRNWLKIPAHMQGDALKAFYLLALSIPAVIATTGLKGLLEAQQRFELINAVRISLGIFTYASPLIVLPFSGRLFLLVAILVGGRLTAMLLYLMICLRIMPQLRASFAVHRAFVYPLLRFGGWVTVSNIISPLMTYLDRFWIGALVSISAVAYYITPFEVVGKFTLIPMAVIVVLFPGFATSFAHDSSKTARLFARGVKSIFLSLFPITILVVTLAQEGLNLWLGQEFALHSSRVLQLLAIGVFVNSLAHVPVALIQGMGRPDLTAKLHCFELPLYCLAVWLLIRAYGIEGAAIAWVARAAFDAIILFWMARSLLPQSNQDIHRLALITGAALLILAFPLVPMGLYTQRVFLSLVLATFALAAWFLILAPKERAFVQNFLRVKRVLK
jgi:O-antigen/teichoic acid export membrane protein